MCFTRRSEEKERDNSGLAYFRRSSNVDWIPNISKISEKSSSAKSSKKSDNLPPRKKTTVEDVQNIGVQYFGKKGTRAEYNKSRSKDEKGRFISNDYPPAVKRNKKKK